jgi:hypothetical protein
VGSDSGSVNYALGLGDTEGVDSERAETHLRLVAEAELRRATMIPTDGARQWHAQRGPGSPDEKSNGYALELRWYGNLTPAEVAFVDPGCWAGFS